MSHADAGVDTDTGQGDIAWLTHKRALAVASTGADRLS